MGEGRSARTNCITGEGRKHLMNCNRDALLPISQVDAQTIAQHTLLLLFKLLGVFTAVCLISTSAVVPLLLLLKLSHRFRGGWTS